MRLTTKIVIGIIISIFLLSLCFIIGVSFIDTEKFERRFNVNQPSISQETIIAVDIEPYQTIWIDEEEYQEVKNIFLQGMIRINPVSKQEDTNKLFMPEALLQFVNIIYSSDTLIIRLKTDKLYERYVKNREEASFFSNSFRIISGVNFFAHPNTVDIVCNVDRIKVDIRNITTDKIRIQTVGDIEIDSCQVEIIESYARKNWPSFLLKNSQVKELNIDLDQTGRSWKIENCEIEVENLTGSGNHSVVLPKSEAKIMNWIPKDKDAKLTVTLYGDTARIVFP